MDTRAFYVGGWSEYLAPPSAGQVQAFDGDLLGFSHGVRHDGGPNFTAAGHVQLFGGASGEPVAAADQLRAMSSGLQEEGVETPNDRGRGRSPGRDREAEGQHLPDIPGEGGGERGGEEPHWEPGAATRGGTLRRDLEAAERTEEQDQVDEGDPAEVVQAKASVSVVVRSHTASLASQEAERAEEQGQVQVGHAGEGHRAASPGLDAKALSMAAADHLDANASSDNTTAASVRSTSASADPSALISDSEAIIVHRVWSENCDEVFERVVDKLRQPRRHLYIALDLEFVAGASTNVRFRPICWNSWYDHLRTLVNGGEMLQIGLAFDLDVDHQHGGAQAPSSPVMALEINLKFDVDAREYNDASVAFLAQQGHRLTDYRDRGVTTEQLLDGLLRHIPFGDDSVTWVTFHGDGDFGFLLRLLLQQQGRRRGALPPDRAAFMRQVREQFPLFYDVRVLGQLEKEGFTGSLKALAAHLGVRRIGGEHHAGSDALLTLSCFKVIHHRNEHKPHRLHSRQCLLSGMEEFDMAIKCARHIDDASVITVEVRGHNFNKEARLIDELVTSNFKTAGVDVQIPQLDWGTGIPICAADLQHYYGLVKSSLRGIHTFQVTIGFMNAEGMLAYGRVWKFHLSSRADLAVAGGGNNAYVRPRQLGCLMALCGATHNPNVTWVVYQGSPGMACLIKSFLAAADLPSDWSSYIEHQRGFFPNLYDAGLIAQRCPDIAGQPLGMGMLLVPQVLLVLRCYKRLLESPWFPHIAEAVRGQLMARQGCFWY